MPPRRKRVNLEPLLTTPEDPQWQSTADPADGEIDFSGWRHRMRAPAGSQPSTRTKEPNWWRWTLLSPSGVHHALECGGTYLEARTEKDAWVRRVARGGYTGLSLH